MTSLPSKNSRHPLQWLAIAMLLAGVCGCAIFGGGGGEGSGWHPKYEVEKGDTLYSIAWAHGLDYRELAAWNGIKPPYQIKVGDMLRLTAPEDFVYYPPDERSADSRPARPVTRPPTPAKVPAKPAATPGSPKPSESPVFTREPDDEAPVPPAVARAEPEPATVSGDEEEPGDEDLKWRWPVQGAVLRTYAPADGSSGLDIGGTTGQQVRAASSGKVVYGGSGLQGYGLLVIVKHDDNYLSAYGYNRKLLVQQGDEVHIGQPIAEMGEGPQQKPILHFEVRRAGKTIDPMLILPVKP